MDDPDYIIVGSGAGGGPLAAGLARKGFKVLLLDAGGDVHDSDIGRQMYDVPIFSAACTEYDACSWQYFVDHFDDPVQARRDPKFDELGGGVWYPRTSTLGGCTAHNAMIMVTPQALDWDFIAKLTGDWSWRAENMFRYFARLERCRYVPRPGTLGHFFKDLIWSLVALWRHRSNWNDWSDGHGFDGWLGTAEARPELLLKDPTLTGLVFRAAKAVTERGVGSLFGRLATGLDPNDLRNSDNSPEGLALTPLSTADGKRNGPREYLLKTREAHPDRLEIRLNTLVTKVIIENGVAVGVETREGQSLYQADPRYVAGTPWTAGKVFAAREVILAGGAFSSPQILKLSGVGPARELASHGIAVVADRPGVGENLQDRYEISIVSCFPKPFALLDGAEFAPTTDDAHDPYLKMWEDGQGLYTSNGTLLGVMKRSAPELPEPDLYIFALPGDFRGYERGYSKTLDRFHDKLTWVILKAYTNNQAGRVLLRDADPTQTPSIHFRCFGEGSDEQHDDIDGLLEGFKFVRQLNECLDMDVAKELWPGPKVQGDEALRDFIRNGAWGHHASCTNQIGPASDPMAVLDSRFRVRGVDRLRVVDASVFPRIPGYFIVSAVYMISEKAVDVIAEDAPKTPRRSRP